MNLATVFADIPGNQLTYTIRHLTRLALFELPPNTDPSLYKILASYGLSLDFVGLVLEQQIATIDETLSKPELYAKVFSIFQDALKVYGNDFPIRRARYVKCHSQITELTRSKGFCYDN